MLECVFRARRTSSNNPPAHQVQAEVDCTSEEVIEVMGRYRDHLRLTLGARAHSTVRQLMLVTPAPAGVSVVPMGRN